MPSLVEGRVGVKFRIAGRQFWEEARHKSFIHPAVLQQTKDRFTVPQAAPRQFRPGSGRQEPEYDEMRDRWSQSRPMPAAGSATAGRFVSRSRSRPSAAESCINSLKITG